MDYQNLLLELSKIPTFVGSIPHSFSTKSYMNKEDVIKELQKRYDGFCRLNALRGCGELTKNERAELKLLDIFFKNLITTIT